MAKSERYNAQYSFNLLRDESIDIDLFEDKTHERVADSILSLTTNEEKGISIGLEGSWGSGKSTVISILKRKLTESNSSIPLIQFDAWAHEGDPLRRIFLESLIDEIDCYVKPNGKKKLNELKEKIARRYKERNIKSTRSATPLGKWLSIALFLVPIGLGLLSSVGYLKLNWAFLVGLILSGAPLLVVGVNIICLFFKNIFKNKRFKEKWKDIFKSKNWAFLEQEADEKVTQEVSEEDERSSIEFERYFNQIMEIVFKNSGIKKIILVVDNLDRVDPDDALKIWSTLQTFLSQRSQTWRKKEWFDRIWIIVPYDAEGLSRLWNKRTDEINTEVTDQNLSKPFFDKSFQLRVEVPRPIFSGWERFARQMMEISLEGWSQDDKDELIRILRMTRKDLADTPTPREIKNYINRVGFLASQWGNVISISSIAYYVYWRELAEESVECIKSKLVANELKDARHKTLLPEKCIKELAGLVFGVSPEKGFQLLLEPHIFTALKNEDGESLKGLCEKHGHGFWHIFNYHIEHHDMDIGLAISSAKAIYDRIWKDNSEKCKGFVNKVSKIDVSNAPKEFKWDEGEIEKYLCLIQICREEKVFIQSLYYHLIDCLRSYIKKEENVEWEKVIISLSKVIEDLVKLQVPISRETVEELSLSNLISMTRTSSALENKAYKWIAPPENIVDEIKKAIVLGQPLQDGLSKAVHYSINAGIKEGWNAVLSQSQQYINWNSGNYSNQSDEIFRLINAVTFKFRDVDEINQIASDIVESGEYHNLLWQRRGQNLIHAALLCGYVFKKKLQSKTIPTVGNSVRGFIEIKNFWANSNPNNAKQVLEEIKRYNLWSFLWELAADTRNKLVKDIIIKALDDKHAIELFRIKEGLVKLKYFSELFDENEDKDEKVLELIGKFTEYAGLENEIITADDIDLIDYGYELYLIIKQTKNQQVIARIVKELKEINKENWIKALTDDTYLTSLAIEVKKKDEDFYLENDFTDAVLEFVQSQNDYTNWQKEHWDELISLMGKNFQKYCKDKITEYLRNNLQTISSETFNLNKAYFIYQEILSKTKQIQEAIDKSVKNGDIERLHIMNEILSNGTFKPEDYFLEVIKKPLRELYSKQDSKEKKEVIKSLAEKLCIDLLDNNKEVEEEE